MVFTELVQLSFDKIMQTRSYTVVVLGAPEKRFAIFTDPNVGRLLQMCLAGVVRPRPLTHDLLSMTLTAFGVCIKQVVISDLQETVYHSKVFLEQQREGIRHIVEVDARPSDCITLALMNNVPLFCTREVLDETIALDA